MTVKLDFIRRRWHEIILLLLFSGIVSFQLFVPPFVGMADNADFKKVTAMFCLGPRDGNPHYYGFFVPDLKFAPQNCYYNDQVPSSEWLFTLVGVKLHSLFGGGANFDIREVGAVKAIVFIAGFFALLVALRPLGQIFQSLVGVAAIWMFTDVLYVAYLNSFYIDSAALLGAFIAVPVAIIILRAPERPSWLLLVLFTAAVLLFAVSKGQHGFSAWLGSIALLVAAWRLPRNARVGVIAMALLIVIASIYMMRSTPTAIRGQALFNVVMLRLLPHSLAPAKLGQELRLTPDEVKLTGRHAFLPDNPPIDFVGLYYRVFPRLTKWYVLHPGETIHWLYHDLESEAPRLRFNGGGNFRIEDGKPFGTLTTRFASWSTLKAATIRRMPLALPIWYIIVFLGAIALLIYRQPAVPTGQVYVILAIALIAVIEYCVASLFDAAGETNRHLFLFHTFTDLTLVFAAATVISLWGSRMRSVPADIGVAIHRGD